MIKNHPKFILHLEHTEWISLKNSLLTFKKVDPRLDSYKIRNFRNFREQKKIEISFLGKFSVIAIFGCKSLRVNFK